ncbi:hypothetical protein C8J56DRAFT_1063066 [Mycena floridula]|nr:hypothetical protein C8J56DRAFT_1063066 [Mycena floridula]
MTFSLVLLTTDRAPNVVDGLRPGTGTSMVHMPVPEGRTRKGLIIEIIVALVPIRSPSPMEFRPENLELNEKYINVLFQYKKCQMELDFCETRNKSIASERDSLSQQNDELREQISRLTAEIFGPPPSSSSSSSAQSALPSSDRVIRNLPRPRILPNQPFPGVSPNFAGNFIAPQNSDINSDAAEKARLRTLAKKIASCPNEVEWTQHSAARAAEILLFSAPTRHQVLGVPIIRDATNIRLTKISIAAARGARLAYLTCPSGDDESRRYLVAFAELTSHSGFYAEFLITNKITLPPKAESLMRFMPRAGSSSISAFDVAGHLSGLGVPIAEIDDAFSFGLNIVISQIGGESIRLNDFGLEFWQPLLTESANSLVNKERPKMLDGPEFLFVGDRTFTAVHRRAFPTGVKPKSRIRGARKVTAPPEELKESNNMVIDSPTRNLMEMTLAENVFANSGFNTEVFNFDFGSADGNFGEPSQHWGAGPVLSLT